MYCNSCCLSYPVPRPLRGNESSATAPGQRPFCAKGTSVGLRRRRNQRSRSKTLSAIRISPFTSRKSISSLSGIVEISERVEVAGDDDRKECRVRWRRWGGPSGRRRGGTSGRRGGPSDGPSSDGPSPYGASASGRRRTLLRVAGTGAVAIVMFPRWMFASMRALLETVTWF